VAGVSARPGFFAGLAAGLLRPSALTVGVALAAAALTLAVGLRSADEALLRSAQLAVDPTDDYAFLAAAALRLPPPPGAVVVLGSSALREAITDPAALATAAGVPVAALWTAGGLSHLELLTLVDRLPPDPRRLTLVELSERNLSLGATEAQALLDRPRLPLDGPTQDAAAARAGLRPPRREAALALRHPTFFLARLPALTRLGQPPPAPIQHQIEALALARPEDEARWARRLAGWWAELPAESARNTMLYADLVAALKAKGGAVLLVAAPRNPSIVAAAAAMPGATGGPAAAQAARAAAAQAAGAALVDPATGLDLRPEDYADYAHLVRPTARARFTAALGNAARAAAPPARPPGRRP
jgi:hypothetical protein